MKLTRTVVMPAIAVATIAAGSGTAMADPAPPAPLPHLTPVAAPALPPLPQLAPPQLPQLAVPQLAVPKLPGQPGGPTLPNATETAADVAQRAWPQDQAKREAFVVAANEVVKGFDNGGLTSVMIGANLGSAIGCVSIFPNFMAGCILGTGIGAVSGLVVGVKNGNPNAQAAVEKFLATP